MGQNERQQRGHEKGHTIRDPLSTVLLDLRKRTTDRVSN